MTLTWIAAQNIIRVILPEAGLQLLLDYMQVVATVEDRDIFARYRLLERKWDFSVLVHQFGDPVADAFYAKQQFPPKLRFDNLYQYIELFDVDHTDGPCPKKTILSEDESDGNFATALQDAEHVLHHTQDNMKLKANIKSLLAGYADMQRLAHGMIEANLGFGRISRRCSPESMV